MTQDPPSSAAGSSKASSSHAGSAATSEDMSAYQCRLLYNFIERQLAHHRQTFASTAPISNGASASIRRPPPLILGMQGPQGSGKTTLTSALCKGPPPPPPSQGSSTDSSPPIKFAILSIDDLYLPFEGLKQVAEAHPTNILLQGRGQPGTHDLELGSRVLRQLYKINDVEDGGYTQAACGSGGKMTAGKQVQIPIFDKSQHGGKGDRSAEVVTVTSPLDVVLLEGWCLGFESLTEEQLSDRYQAATAEKQSRPPYFLKHSLEDLQLINRNLAKLEKAWYPHIKGFVQLVPSTAAGEERSEESDNPLDVIFDWRLQAEHQMKSKNGGKGMNDEEVHKFVERYMPGYELFGDRQGQRCNGQMLRIGLGRQREVLWVEEK